MRDGKHPNRAGAHIMAHLWFKTLLNHDGRKVPEWSRREMRRAIEAARAENLHGGPRRSSVGPRRVVRGVSTLATYRRIGRPAVDGK